MSTIGEAIKAERLRLGMNQEEFGAAGGVKKRTQISYEQDERSPDAVYLKAISSIGVDVQFILTGDQATASLTQDEKELLSGYRGLDIRGKAGVLGMIDGMSSSPVTKPENATPTIVFHGKVGQQVTGDITGKQTFNLGSKKK
ncbi:helix-turn-helix domain-containing protein [Janthinobacterium sp. Mn2066]|uniref:helix-turn-helix domain-containing protein n=1 Tax=Janthinobacterium sp. Mn2066 TaxID=3395264 RepID=UPI003BE90B47